MNSEQQAAAGDSLTDDRCKFHSEIFDFQDFLNRLGGDENVLRDFIRDIPNHLSRLISQLKTALDRRDAQEIRMNAHSIKGVCSNLSAKSMAEIASEAELAGERDQIDAAVHLTEKLEHEFAKLQSVLSEMFPGIFQIPAEIEYEKKSENMPEETKERLPELISMMEKEFLPKWEKHKDMFYFDGTEELASELQYIAVEYQIDFLFPYSRKLQHAAQNFDFEAITELTAEFPSVMDRIRKMASG